MRFAIITILLNFTFLMMPHWAMSQETDKEEIDIDIQGELPDSVAQKYKIVVNDVASPDHFYGLILKDFTIKEPQGMPLEEVNEKAHQVINQSMNKFSAESADIMSDIFTIYVNQFTAEELQQLAEFFQSDLGKKLKNADGLAFPKLLEAKKMFEEIKEEEYKKVFEPEDNSSNKKKGKKKKKN